MTTKAEMQLRVHWIEGYFIAGAAAADGIRQRRPSIGGTPVIAATEQPFRLFLFPASAAPELPAGAHVATLDLHPLSAILAASACVCVAALGLRAG